MKGLVYLEPRYHLKTKLENQFGKDFINDKVIIMDLDDLDDENNNPTKEDN